MNIPLTMHLIATDRENHFPRGMYSWNTRHNNWRYIVWDYDKVKTHKWKDQELIKTLLDNNEHKLVEQYIRYQILLGLGGVVVPHDSINLLCINPLFKAGNPQHIYADDTFKMVASKKHNPLVATFQESV